MTYLYTGERGMSRTFLYDRPDVCLSSLATSGDRSLGCCRTCCIHTRAPSDIDVPRHHTRATRCAISNSVKSLSPTLSALQTHRTNRHLTCFDFDADIRASGGWYGIRTHATLRLYSLANCCIAPLPTIHMICGTRAVPCLLCSGL